MSSFANPKIFFVIPYPLDEVPGQRFRFEQYLSILQKKGFDIRIHPFLTTETNKILYHKKFYRKKISGVLMGLVRRIKLLGSIRSASYVFLFREATPFGPPIFEWVILSILRKKVIYDFDDSIWLTDRKTENMVFRFLKWRSKVGFICKQSRVVSCGNEYLASFSRTFNQNVKIVPTTIDTDQYKPCYQPDRSTIIIGWSGSVTTVKYFNFAIPVLTAIKQKYGDSVAFKVIGDGNFENEELNIKGIPWVRESEIVDLSEFTIGIMPLPDDPWTRGKCGLKGLQYMALGIPTVMSPVGVNKEIIQDGSNGFIANNDKEWIAKISKLIENRDLRVQMGMLGRKTVEEKYSVKSQMENYFSLFTD